MNLTYQDYHKRLIGCFIGKCVGGTLGMPYEGEERLLNLTYYDPVPTEMLANDDLDLQVVWLERIRRFGLPVNRRYLAGAWTENIRGVCDEYGVAQRNVRHMLYPPASGAYDNKFYAGMGAAIRTEIWACLAPGDPALAVEFAREDACSDHCDDGVEAACFLAALESAAFVESDRDALLNIGFSYISPDGRLSRVLKDTIRWWNECHDFVQVRQQVLDTYYVQNWTDVSLNLAFIVLGWLAGGGDFGKALCTAVNCGNDTDCTGATLGALLGILNPDGISEKWSRPIGNKLVLSNGIMAMHETDTIDDMCEQIAALSVEVQKYYHSCVTTTDCPVFSANAQKIAPPWKDRPDGTLLAADYCQRESTVALTPVYTVLRYPEGIAIPKGESRVYELDLLGLQNSGEDCTIRLNVPDGWTVEPSLLQGKLSASVVSRYSFTVTAPAQGRNTWLNLLDICIQTSSMRADLTAGLVTAIDWLRTPAVDAGGACPAPEQFRNAQTVHALGHYQKVPAGAQWYTAMIKGAWRMNDAVMIAEGNRAMRVWIDGELVSETDGSFYVPAAHRGPARKKIDLISQWYQVVIEVADGVPDGEIFFGLIKPFGREWIEDLEWDLPTIDQ